MIYIKKKKSPNVFIQLCLHMLIPRLKCLESTDHLLEGNWVLFTLCTKEDNR